MRSVLALLTCALCNIYIMQLPHRYWMDLNVVVIFGAYLVFDMFLIVYSVVIDTMMLCVREYKHFSSESYESLESLPIFSILSLQLKIWSEMMDQKHGHISCPKD